MIPSTAFCWCGFAQWQEVVSPPPLLSLSLTITVIIIVTVTITVTVIVTVTTVAVIVTVTITTTVIVTVTITVTVIVTVAVIVTVTLTVTVIVTVTITITVIVTVTITVTVIVTVTITVTVTVAVCYIWLQSSDQLHPYHGLCLAITGYNTVAVTGYSEGLLKHSSASLYRIQGLTQNPSPQTLKIVVCLQYCAQNFLSESALEAIEAGRAEFAATLMDMGLLPHSFHTWFDQQSKSGTPGSQSEPHEFDAYCNNARIIKAALCAGTSFATCRNVVC